MINTTEYKGTPVYKIVYNGMAFQLIPLDITQKGLFIELRENYRNKHYPVIFLIRVVSSVWLMPVAAFKDADFNSHTITQHGIEGDLKKLLTALKEYQSNGMKSFKCDKCFKFFSCSDEQKSFCNSECINEETEVFMPTVAQTNEVTLTSFENLMSPKERELFPVGMPDFEVPDYQDFVLIGHQKVSRCYHWEDSGNRVGRRCLNASKVGGNYCSEHSAGGAYTIQKIFQTGLEDPDEARAIETFVQQTKKDFPLIITKPSMEYSLYILGKLHVAILKANIVLRTSASFRNLLEIYDTLTKQLGISGEQTIKYKTKHDYEEIERTTAKVKEIIQTVCGPCPTCGPLVQLELKVLDNDLKTKVRKKAKNGP